MSQTRKTGRVAALTHFATRHPRAIFLTVAVLVLGVGSQIARVVVDTDPKNMLPPEQAERLFDDVAKKTFQLHDMLVVGVVNNKDKDGVFNPQSLARIHALSRKIARLDGVIERDLMSLSTVDKVTPEGAGTVRFSWLLEEPPKTRAEALKVRAAALRLPMFRGTLVTEDGKAVAIYVPLKDKKKSHQISEEIKKIVSGFSGAEQYFITGLPVAEDTFGVEMFIQMAISAPLAALVIFIIMWWFFRSFPLIAAPMIIAMSAVIITAGTLIGLGFKVHIMSSMIPIFLMPIAVVDSIHILSEFSDHYVAGKDKREVVASVMDSLFTPMFYTSLTTIAGFGSLVFAPIPPVRVFGAFVALGVLISFLLSVIFIPAYLAALSDATLAKLPGSDQQADAEGRPAKGLIARFLPKMGRLTVKRSLLVVLALVTLTGISIYGVTRIVINDNPMLWFKASHQIRVADRALNKHFAGTYPAYLVLERNTAEPRAALSTSIAKAIARTSKDDAAARSAKSEVATQYAAIVKAVTAKRFGERLTELIDKVDSVTEQADAAAEKVWQAVMGRLEKAQADSKFFQTPEALSYIAGLQKSLAASKRVGKSTSIVDVVRTLNRDLHDGAAKYNTIPKSSAGVAQALLTYQSSHRPHDLWHFVTPDMGKASIWVQLKSGDNQNMQRVVDHLERYVKANPAPTGVKLRWAGSTYLNVIWQNEMVKGMMRSLLGSFAIVLLMMIFLFRSVIFGLLSMIPLSITITFIYGLIGLVGKDYDMPVAVLSALTLGLSIDFAIHFLERARTIKREVGTWDAALEKMFHAPGRAISRNAIVISVGFLPLLAAPLVPYITVGFFMAAIMVVSGLVTLLLLPAVMHLIQRHLPMLRAEKLAATAQSKPTKPAKAVG